MFKIDGKRRIVWVVRVSLVSMVQGGLFCGEERFLG